MKIRLNNGGWDYDETRPLGPPGGFGEVFHGTGPAGDVAVKRLKLTASAAAHREMNIGQALAGRYHRHVVPVLDYGQDANSDGYFLVMPVCDRSLQDELNLRRRLPVDEARRVAVEILKGLDEVGDIVHRDLKPGNVLLLEGRWQLADFGIAKFVEDSTSLVTLRRALTPFYGAPEQWREEAPTKATDIYALGCIMHAMINGAPPFRGSNEDVREAHLLQVPPQLEASPALSSFVGQMLRKVSDARPSITRCIDVLQKSESTPANGPNAALAAASDRISRAKAAAEAELLAVETRERQRTELIADAAGELAKIAMRLISDIEDIAHEAECEEGSASLGQGTLRIGRADSVQASPLAPRNYEQRREWQVAASATIGVAKAAIDKPDRDSAGNRIVWAGRERPEDKRYVWTATLFYGCSEEHPDYRWREVGFCSHYSSKEEDTEPFAVGADKPEFGKSLKPYGGQYRPAYGPLPIDGEDEEAFRSRWISIFTRAVEGKLVRPSSFPLSIFDLERLSRE